MGSGRPLLNGVPSGRSTAGTIRSAFAVVPPAFGLALEVGRNSKNAAEPHAVQYLASDASAAPHCVQATTSTRCQFAVRVFGVAGESSTDCLNPRYTHRLAYPTMATVNSGTSHSTTPLRMASDRDN